MKKAPKAKRRQKPRNPGEILPKVLKGILKPRKRKNGVWDI